MISGEYCICPCRLSNGGEGWQLFVQLVSHATVFVFDSVAHHLLTPDVIVLGSELVVLRANDSAFQVQGE